MNIYQNPDSGIKEYEYSNDWIKLLFDTGLYQYDRSVVGNDAFGQMTSLADKGRGLNTYINQHRRIKDAGRKIAG